MTVPTYSVIPNSDIDPESPLTTALFTLLRDNPIALNALWTYTDTSTASTVTIPFDGYYQIICVGGGQGGDGGEDGSAGGWTETTIVNRRVAKDSGGSDVNSGGIGGDSSVYLGATELITSPGGGSISAPSYKTGYLSIERQFSGTAAAQANPGAGGDGGSSIFGVGGVGAASQDGTDATGYGAGGGGGWVQDGAQLGSFGNGGMGGNCADTLLKLVTNDVLTITVGDGGAAQTGSRGNGGAGTQGIVMIKWWPDTLNLGL